jgi:hypothetical protein
MTNTATLSLTNAHGLFEVPVRTLTRALAATKHRSDALIRIQACGHCGYGEFDIEGPTPLDDCSRLETLIIWIESGNHTF